MFHLFLGGNMYTLYTPSDKGYQYMWMSSDSHFFTFRVKACHDATVGLSQEPGVTTDNTYEVIIGGRKNTATFIRKIFAGDRTIWKELPIANLTSCNETRPFWVTWRSSVITVGRGLVINQNPFLTWQDPNPMRVTGVAITTGWGSDGVWEVQQDQGKNCEDRIKIASACPLVCV